MHKTDENPLSLGTIPDWAFFVFTATSLKELLKVKYNYHSTRPSILSSDTKSEGYV